MSGQFSQLERKAIIKHIAITTEGGEIRALQFGGEKRMISKIMRRERRE
jgi:hypothetical protein